MSTPVDTSPPRHGLLQYLGLDFRVAALTLLVDEMVFGMTLASFGTLYLVEVMAGVVLGIIAYKIQRHWYGDGHESALIKGLIIGLLTAIPTPLSTLAVAGPAGVLGLLHQLFALRSRAR